MTEKLKFRLHMIYLVFIHSYLSLPAVPCVSTVDAPMLQHPNVCLRLVKHGSRSELASLLTHTTFK